MIIILYTMEDFEKALKQQVAKNKYNGYADFDECDFCINKVTTQGCLSCKIYSIKGAIAQINLSILSHQKDDIVLFIFNEMHRSYIEKYALIGLIPVNCIKWTNNLENDYVGVVVDKKWFNEGA